MNRKILIVGSLNMDIVVKVDNMPKVGETVIGWDLCYIPGGKGANQACAVGKLSGNATMLGKVGNDTFGETLLESLLQANVDITGIERSETTTGTALIWVNSQGDNSIIVTAGANAECDLPYIETHRQAILDADIVIVQMEIPQEAVYGLIRLANVLGKTVILNPAPAPADFPSELYPCIDYITPNETELEILSDMEVNTAGQIAQAARTLLRKGVGKVVVTCGKLGAMLVDADGWNLYPVIDVPVTDTTAAGDSFNAGFAVALTEGKTEVEAIAFANKVATLVVTRPGAQSSIPTRAEVDSFEQIIN